MPSYYTPRPLGPMKNPKAGSLRGDAAGPPPRRVVLVVDDLDSTREVMAFYLEQIGLEVIHARDGKEAVALAQQKNPPLVVMDVLMPVMDGYTACTEIKKDPGLNGVKVIMVSALTSQADKNRAEAAGADAYLEKPIAMGKLTETVKRLLP